MRVLTRCVSTSIFKLGELELFQVGNSSEVYASKVGEEREREYSGIYDGFYRQPRVVPQRMRSDKAMPRVSGCGSKLREFKDLL